MLELLKHRLRQISYRYLTFNCDAFYRVFDLMYHNDKDPLPWVHYLPDEKGYLLTHFLCKDFKAYCGREVAFFNRNQLTVYWLPGAEHSAGGYVKDGQYQVTIADFALHRPIHLTVEKKPDLTEIKNIDVLPYETNTRLEGGFVTYQAIRKEIVCLIIHWLDRNYHLSSNSTTFQLILNESHRLNEPSIQEKLAALSNSG